MRMTRSTFESYNEANDLEKELLFKKVVKNKYFFDYPKGLWIHLDSLKLLLSMKKIWVELKFLSKLVRPPPKCNPSIAKN